MEPTLARYLSAVPTDEETVRQAVRPYRELDTGARLDALRSILRDMDALLAGRLPLRSPDDAGFWWHWMDPGRGRPR